MRPVEEIRAIGAGVRAAAPGRASIALRTALCVAVPLSVGLVAGQSAAGAAASFGGLAGLSVPQAPYRYRARVVASVGVGLVLAVLLGGLAGGNAVTAAVTAGLVAGVASFICQAAQLPPPRELMLVMAVLAATDLAGGPQVALQRAALAAAGAVFAWLVTMAPALWGRRREPERRAVAAAARAIAGLLDAVGSPAAGVSRNAAVLAVRRARVAVEQGGLPAGHRLASATVAVEAVLEAALHVDVESSGPLDAGWGRAVRELAPGPGPGSGAGSGSAEGGSAVAGTVGADGLPGAGIVGAELLSSAIRDARAVLAGGVPVSAARPALRAWPGIWPQLGAAVRRHSIVLPAAARIGVAVAVGVGLGRALGLAHAYWIGLTVAAVLQGSNLAVTRSRVVRRVVGTVLGVGVAFAVLGWDPPLWSAVVAVALCQAAVELVITVHYGLAVVGITVLALVLFHIGAPGEDVASAIGDRLLDTAIGAASALLLRWALWPRATSARLPQVQAEAVRGVRRVLSAAWARSVSSPDPAVGADAVIHERRRLQGELVGLRAVHADALADAGARPPDLRWPVSVAIEELSVLALSWPQQRVPPGAGDAQAFLEHLDGLATAAADGGPPGPTPSVLPGHPRTLAAAGALAVAVREANRGSPTRRRDS